MMLPNNHPEDLSTNLFCILPDTHIGRICNNPECTPLEIGGYLDHVLKNYYVDYDERYVWD
jgi:hypothetical protein